MTENAVSNQELVDFYGDSLTTIQDNDGEIWAVANDILRCIGFDDSHVKNTHTMWRKDLVVSKGLKYQPMTFSSGVKDTVVIRCRTIPLALAKISMTPTMQREQPELVNKLVRYQEECADALYKHFYKKPSTDVTAPLTREEMASYYMVMMDSFKQYTSILDQRDQKLSECMGSILTAVKDMSASQVDSIKALVTSMSSKTEIKEQVKETPTFSHPLLVNSISTKESTEWLQKAWHNADMISKRANKKSSYVLKDIYKMIRDDGTDIDGAFEEFSATGSTTKVEMCAVSDTLRTKVNHYFNVLAKQYYPERYTIDNILDEAQIKVSLSTQLLKTPEVVKTKISNYASAKALPYTYACRVLYSEMNKKCGIDIKKEAKKLANAKGCTNCCPGYLIANTPELLSVLDELVSA